ncbi:sensor histidine kinase [Arsenicibacter rosenii]|uniref:sensor histidine kinase n=1 Tax=Arsenicibacter rosenii TaxID=1750698 RepID=UPI000AD3FAC5|nr:histidine kinase [Arsenicibacter rosenii]
MPASFTYRFRVKWTALLGALSFGIVVPTFFIPTEFGTTAHYLSILVATVTSYVIWEGSKFIQALTLYFFPWEKSIAKHLVFEILGIFLFSSLALITGIVTHSKLVSSVVITAGIVIQNNFVSFLLALLFIAFNEGAFLFNQWKLSLVEQERLRQENLVARLEGLKKQLDPHFLFNSLSVLSGVVYKDPALADLYITKLAQVYRYLLDHNEERQVRLQEEISVVQAYCFLLNVRFYNKITISIQEPLPDRFVLPLSLQLLVENAVKHNFISDEHPLTLTIYLQDDLLWVENSLNKKESPERSPQIGLNNLQARYAFVTDRPIVIQEDRQRFRVGLPLLRESYESANH